MRAQKTHDYTRGAWGHTYTVISIHEDGHRLEMAGWGYDMQVGDFLLLRDQVDIGASTRYQVEALKYERDPNDMWKATVRFAPRR